MQTNNDKIESFSSEFKSEISSLKDGLQQTIENVVDVKLTEFSAKYDQELDEVRKDVTDVKTNSSIRAYIRSSQALNEYSTGLFIPNVREQFKKILDRSDHASFIKAVSNTNNFMIASECVGVLVKILTPISKDVTLKELFSGLHVRERFMVGTGDVQHFIVKFTTPTAASQLRELLLAYNKHRATTKDQGLRFSRTKTGLAAVDKLMTQANVILFTAKKSKLLKSYVVAPRLSSSGTDLTLHTTIRLEGELSYRPLNWTAQSYQQAKSDLHAALNSPDTAEWKAFSTSLEELESTAATRKQPERRQKNKK